MRPLAVAVSGAGLVDPDGPVLAADDEGFTRGRAAFETLRVYGGRPFRFDQHVERLRRSAASLGIEPPDAGAIAGLVRLALDNAGVQDASLRLYWTPGHPDEGPRAVVTVGAIPPSLEEMRATGIRLAAVAIPRRDEPWLLPGAKSVSYAVNMAVEAEARRRGADDAVFVDRDGIVLEGPTTNVFWRRGTTLSTPSVGLGILAGETRAAVSELAGGCGYTVEEVEAPLAALLAAEEVFTSSSVREIMPVVEVDGQAFPSGPAAGSLQRALREAATR